MERARSEIEKAEFQRIMMMNSTHGKSLDASGWRERLCKEVFLREWMLIITDSRTGNAEETISILSTMKPWNILFTSLLSLWTVSVALAEDGLVAHWPLTEDAKDLSGAARHAENHGVTFHGNKGASFDGIDSWLEVPSAKAPQLGSESFTLSAWVHTEENLDDVLGDVMSWYDPATRNGFNFSIMNYAGVTCAQSNWRNVFFGIDAKRGGDEWVDCGRPGNNQLVNSLVVFNGELYCSTWEPEENGRGHVYRYAGGKEWIDCGAPDKANCIKAMAVYKGKLYVGSELYSGGGSSLPLSPNTHHGGSVFRYEGGTNWTNCGKVADVRSISGC